LRGWSYDKEDIDEIFAVAGLREHWEPKDGTDQAPIKSLTIIVTDANELLKPIHDRMPVILDSEQHDLWLGGAPDEADELLHPFPSERLRAYPVSTRVKSLANDDPGGVAPLED
jgi:putative SOS response-associated peptidase YedK